MDSRTAQIKDALRRKQQEQAKSYLRSRKALEELLARRTSASETLGGVLLKIEQAAGDAELVAAFDVSAEALKKVLADPNLQVDRVDATMDKLAEAVADQKTVDEAIQSGSAGVTGDIDDDEIAAELRALEAEAGASKQTTHAEPAKKPVAAQSASATAAERLAELPSVPSAAPDANGKEENKADRKTAETA